MPTKTYDPSTEFTTAQGEWTALLALAHQSSPARAISLGGWRADAFATPGAADAFTQLAAAIAPTVILPPADLQIELANAPTPDAEALQALQARLAHLAQARALATLQARLAQELRGLDPQGDLEGVTTLTSEVRKALASVATLGGQRRMASTTLAALAGGYWDRISQRAAAMPTGLGMIDDALGGGLQTGRLLALLGAPGSGKTTLANQWAEHIADSGRPVVYLTLEDSPETLLAKTLARVGGLDYGAALHGYANQRPAISQALATVAQRRSAQRLIYVEDMGGLTLADVREIAAGHFARYDTAHGGGAGVLVVDYLQRLARLQRGPDMRDDLRIIVGRLTEDLRMIARDLDCSVIAIASMNRASGYGKDSNASVLASAKEAGDIEYTADILMALTEAPENATRSLGHKPMLLRIDKNRLGETAQIGLDWYPARQHFTEKQGHE